MRRTSSPGNGNETAPLLFAIDSNDKNRRPRGMLLTLGLAATAVVLSLYAIARSYAFDTSSLTGYAMSTAVPGLDSFPASRPLLRDYHPANALAIRVSSTCSMEFLRYEPSPYETEWLANVKEWGKDEATYCATMRSQTNEIDIWIRNVSTFMNVQRTSVPTNLRPQDKNVLSRFVYEETCMPLSGSGDARAGSPKRRLVYSYIEPLASSLRDPRAFCFPDLEEQLKKAGDRNSYMVGRKDYIYLAASDDPSAAATKEVYVPGGRKRGNVIYMDLGASTFNDGLGGASQSFFYSKYGDRGLKFDRMLNWEVTPQNVNKLLAEVPGDMYPNYQYFNVPADPTVGNPKNPLEILKKIARPEDFVILKLDIDNTPIELAFVEQILQDESIYRLIDEMFFEHHVWFIPMQRRHWGDSADRNQTLADSFDLFLALRERGIRMHGWV